MTRNSEKQSPLLSSLHGFERVVGILDQLTVDDLLLAIFEVARSISHHEDHGTPIPDVAVVELCFAHLEGTAVLRGLEPAKGGPEISLPDAVAKLAPGFAHLRDDQTDHDFILSVVKSLSGMARVKSHEAAKSDSARLSSFRDGQAFQASRDGTSIKKIPLSDAANALRLSLTNDQLEIVGGKVARYLRNFGVNDGSCQSAIMVAFDEFCSLTADPSGASALTVRTADPEKSQSREVEVEVENPIMKHFAYEHLPEHLQAVSKPICELARKMNAELPNGAEKSAGLRKLLEAKDCFVRAALEGQG